MNHCRDNKGFSIYNICEYKRDKIKWIWPTPWRRQHTETATVQVISAYILVYVYLSPYFHVMYMMVASNIIK